MSHPLARLDGMRSLDRRLQRLAARRDNVVTRPELLGIGMTDHEIETAVSRLRWQRRQRGVYLLGAAPPGDRQRIRIALGAAGDAMAADEAAAFLWGLDGARPPKHIAVVVGPKSQPATPGIAIHRTARIDVRQFRHGIPVTTVEETLLGYARVVSTERLERAVESALLQRHTNEVRLWTFIARNSRPGIRGISALRDVMFHRPKGRPARSVLELIVLRIIRKSGLRLPERNVLVRDIDDFKAELDLAYVDLRKAIEVDGKAFHSTATQTRRDLKRQRRVEALGWEFLRVTWFDAVSRPEWVVSEIRRLLFGIVAA